MVLKNILSSNSFKNFVERFFAKGTAEVIIYNDSILGEIKSLKSGDHFFKIIGELRKT